MAVLARRAFFRRGEVVIVACRRAREVVVESVARWRDPEEARLHRKRRRAAESTAGRPIDLASLVRLRWARRSMNSPWQKTVPILEQHVSECAEKRIRKTHQHHHRSWHPWENRSCYQGWWQHCQRLGVDCRPASRSARCLRIEPALEIRLAQTLT